MAIWNAEIIICIYMNRLILGMRVWFASLIWSSQLSWWWLPTFSWRFKRMTKLHYIPKWTTWFSRTTSDSLDKWLLAFRVDFSLALFIVAIVVLVNKMGNLLIATIFLLLIILHLHGLGPQFCCQDLPIV